MTKRTIPWLLARAAALVLAGASMLVPARAGAAASSERLVITQGTGEVRVQPDSVRVMLGVQADARTAEAARQAVSARMTQVIRDVKALGIPDLTVQTDVVQVSPVRGTRRPGSEQLPPIVGYRATNAVDVTVLRRPPDMLGADAAKIIDTGLHAGANDVGGIQLFRDDLREPQHRALREAVLDAERNAGVIAQAARVTLGEVQSIDGQPQFYAQAKTLARSSLAEAAPTPVEIGEITVSASVTARFMIAPRAR